MNTPHAIIVDDNLKNVTVLARLLAEQGISSTEITNTRTLDSALAQIDTAHIIFVDLEMPGLNGFDVLEKLKADSRFQRVPVVAYTVHVSEINAARDRGFDSFIAKPLDPDRFPEQLKHILSGKAVWSSL